MARQNQVKHKENLASKKDNESLEQSWDSAEIPSEKLLGAVWVNVYQERHKNSSSSLSVEEWLDNSFSYFLFLFPVIPNLS